MLQVHAPTLGESVSAYILLCLLSTACPNFLQSSAKRSYRPSPCVTSIPPQTLSEGSKHHRASGPQHRKSPRPTKSQRRRPSPPSHVRIPAPASCPLLFFLFIQFFHTGHASHATDISLDPRARTLLLYLLPAMSWLVNTMAVPPILIVLLRVLSAVLPGKLAQLTSFAAFFITSMIMMSVCALYGVFASIFLRTVGYGGLSQWTVARAFKWSMWWTTGVTFRVTNNGGEEALLTRPAVFLGNHQR